MSLPLPRAGQRWSLFLDFDGTLTEYAESPDAVYVAPRLPALLIALSDVLEGALAVVSGRRLDDLDRRLAPARPCAAGLHGLELRYPDGTLRRYRPADGALAAIRAPIVRFARDHPRLLVEDKEVAVALHYRRAPELGAECRSVAVAAARDFADYEVLAGKMVVEIKPRAANKRSAIEAFMSRAPFRGRRPVFAGDDVTDEDGFATINEQGGISIKVGAGDSAAHCRAASVAEVSEWLEALVRGTASDD